jgi:hypothetical protein
VTGPADVSVDGTRLATFVRTVSSITDTSGGLETKPPEGLVVADLQTGVQTRFAVPHNGSLHWSADGNRVLVGLPTGMIVLDVRDGTRTVVDLPAFVRYAQLTGVIG